MAISTNNGKMAVMGLHCPSMPINVYMTSDGIAQGDKQQLIWGFPEISYGALAEMVSGRNLRVDIFQGLMVWGLYGSA